MDTISTTIAPSPVPFASNSTKCFVDRDEFITAMKAIIMVASSLSILGALAIILVSYCKRERDGNNSNQSMRAPPGVQRAETSSFTETKEVNNEEERTDTLHKKRGAVQHPARLILVCISAADIIVAVSHIWGVSNNYVNLQHTSLAYIHGTNISAESTECGAQAVLAIFGALSSFLWSDLLAFMAVLMLRSSSKLKPGYFVSKQAFVFYNFICWGIPFIIVCVLGGVNALGFEEGIDVGKLH